MCVCGMCWGGGGWADPMCVSVFVCRSFVVLGSHRGVGENVGENVCPPIQGEL